VSFPLLQSNDKGILDCSWLILTFRLVSNPRCKLGQCLLGIFLIPWRQWGVYKSLIKLKPLLLEEAIHHIGSNDPLFLHGTVTLYLSQKTKNGESKVDSGVLEQSLVFLQPVQAVTSKQLGPKRIRYVFFCSGRRSLMTLVHQRDARHAIRDARHPNYLHSSICIILSLLFIKC